MTHLFSSSYITTPLPSQLLFFTITHLHTIALSHSTSPYYWLLLTYLFNLMSLLFYIYIYILQTPQVQPITLSLFQYTISQSFQLKLYIVSLTFPSNQSNTPLSLYFPLILPSIFGTRSHRVMCDNMGKKGGQPCLGHV